MDAENKRRRLEAGAPEELNASIRSWAGREGILFQKPPTHSAFPIGKQAGFSFRVESRFSNKRLRSIITEGLGRPFAITERAQGAFAFFLDVDLRLSDPEWVSDWERATERATLGLLEALAPVFSDARSLVTQSTTITLDDKRRVPVKEALGLTGKRGVHIVFDRLVVDKERAMAIRRFLVDAMRAVPMGCDWERVLDESVYKSGSGLRKLWSTKTIKDKGCPVARVVPSEYVVMGLFKGTRLDPERTWRLSQDKARAMRKRDIWRPDSASLVELPPPVAPFAVQKTLGRQRGPKPARAPVPDGVPHGLTDACARILRQLFSSADVGSRFKAKPVGETRIVIQTDSRSCPFREGVDHSSNHAYASIDVHGTIYLACHGSSCKGRRLMGRRLTTEELGQVFRGFDALGRGTGIATWGELEALSPVKRAYVLRYLRDRYANDPDKVFQARMKNFGAFE
jgi:hypothetical protein